MSVTPQSDKTISLTSQPNPAKGPTPKNEFKVPINQRSCFNSPTDALVSPCTQKLMKRMPRKPLHMMSLRPRQVHSYKAHSSLANKENKCSAPPTKERKPLPNNTENES